MPPSKRTKEYVENELPYKILMQIYENSRASLKELGRKLGISYHVVAKVLERLEHDSDIRYTVEVDEKKLGFAEGRIVLIKFGSAPSIDSLKERLQKDIFVQNAYMASGDFDLLLYVVGLNEHEFGSWQFKLRSEMSEYRPIVSASTIFASVIGFFPLRSEILEKSEVLSPLEKRILKLLNEDSRLKLRELVKRAKTTQMRVIYSIKKMKQMGIIKRFTALSQKPDKRLIVAYSVSQFPDDKHKDTRLRFWKEMLDENLKEVVNEYAIITDTVGAFDAIYVCAFNGGEEMSKRGTERIKRLFEFENPMIKSAMLTDLLVGKWPFHLEEYSYMKRSLAASSARET